jgi:hypothetical protein
MLTLLPRPDLVYRLIMSLVNQPPSPAAARPADPDATGPISWRLL